MLSNPKRLGSSCSQKSRSMNNSGNDMSSCAGGPAWEPLSFWFPSDGQGPDPAGGSWESPPGPQEVQGVALRIIALRGAFPSYLSFPDSRSCSPLHTGLHPTYPREIWSLGGDVKSQELKEGIDKVSLWSAELSWYSLRHFLPLFQNSVADLWEHLE